MPLLPNPNPANGRTCIVAEADPFLSRLLFQFVEKSRFRIERVQTGESLLSLLDHSSPALVILDPELPGKIRGWEAFQLARKKNSAGQVPIIVCTWLEEDEAQLLLGEACVYLHKPDLHYLDFAASLIKAGVQNLPDEAGAQD